MRIRPFLSVLLTLVVTFADLGQGQGQDASTQGHNHEPCVFPAMLTQRSRWETQMTTERRRTNAFFRFHPSRMEIRDYSSEKKRVETYTCEEDRGENTYVLKLDPAENKDTGVDSRSAGFVCMQFLSRSDRIVQRKFSRVHAQNDGDICDDLELDDWPLVWPEMDGQYSECPFEGGYEIELLEYMHDEPVCDSNWLKPRMESECIKGEGITIDFRHFDCKAQLGMDLLQKLACLGSWEYGEFVFTILTNQDDLWPKLWLMRLPRYVPQGPQEAGPIHAVLSMDIMADHSEFYGSEGRVPLERVYEVLMTTEVYPTLCENEAAECTQKMCEAPRGPGQTYCQKECGVCNPGAQLKKCKFDRKMQGAWQEIHDKGIRDITVTESMMYAADLLPFQCYELQTEELFEGTGRKALVSIFKNGCKPRFTCAELQNKASDVATYRLSQSIVWPATIKVRAEEVCADAQFRKDPEPLLDKYRSDENKILVKKASPVSNIRRATVPCDLETSMGLSGLANDGKRLLGVLWKAVIGYEEQSHTILHETCPSNDYASKSDLDWARTPHTSRTLRCLASFRFNNDSQFLVVEEDGNEENVECWVIHRYEWEMNPRALVLSPAYCNPYMPIRVDFANDEHFLSKYEVLELAENATDPCSKWKSNVPRPMTTPQETISGGGGGSTVKSTTVDTDTKLTDTEAEVKAPEHWKVKIAGLTSGYVPLEGKVWFVMVAWLIMKLF